MKKREETMHRLSPLFTLFLAITISITAQGAPLKPRIIVLTDISTWETDDHESLIRLLAHADLFEIEGLVISTGYSIKTLTKSPEKGFINIAHSAVNAYEKDLPNLMKRSGQTGHKFDGARQKIGYWPSPRYLRDRILFGSLNRGVKFIGEGNDSPGSKLIIKQADEDDPRPLWVTAWGGGNTMAQSIYRVKKDRTKAQFKAFLRKIRVYTITDQDRHYRGEGLNISAHGWMREKAGRDLLFIWDECAWKAHNGIGKSNWSRYATHIQGHGNLGGQYPKYKYGVEGDTPSFLYLMPTGLNDPEDPSQCSWSGTYKGNAKNLWQDTDSCRSYFDRFYPAAFNNFAARMDWVKSGAGNRNPVIVLDGDDGIGVLTRTPRQGTQVTLDASKTSDPDGDKLTFNWWVQSETSTYPGKIDISNSNARIATVNVPPDSAGKRFHVICEVIDDGTHNLSDYRRIIFKPTGRAAAKPVEQAGMAERPRLNINQGWVFRKGDDPAWARPDCNDSAWKQIPIGVTWEQTGFEHYDGFAWYRLEFVIPQSYASGSEGDAVLVLSMGFIDDADETYFNGIKIGATGAMPPDYETAYRVARKYFIPTARVRWNKTNVIAIRVYDHEGDGGFYKGPAFIQTPRLSDLLTLSHQLSRSDGIYSMPDPLPVTLKISSNSCASYSATLVCTLKNDSIMTESVIGRQQHEIKVGGNSSLHKTISFNPPGPGFYRVLSSLAAGKKKVVENAMTLGYSPDRMKTRLTREDDFEAFWKRRKQELAEVKPAFKVTRSKLSTGHLDVFLVEMRSYQNVRIRGWYTKPRKPGPHPAILSVPGYNGTMRPNLYRRHVATFALNPRGHGNSRDDIDPKGEEYMFLGFHPEHPEKYVYIGAYMDCVRAIDFLCSRPEIDKSRIGVEGGSQGGGLSFAAASLDGRIIFCAPDIPWLGDWVGYLDAAQWPNDHYPKLAARFPGLTFNDINRVLSYMDTMNLADRIQCPVLMSVGLQDPICPPRNSFATFNQVPSRKEHRVYPFCTHGVWHRHNEYKNNWMAKKLGVKTLGAED